MMTTKGAYDLLGILEQDESLARAFAKLMTNVLREEIAPILVPGNANKTKSKAVLISYKYAEYLSGMSPQSIRRLVSNGYVVGANGRLDRACFINYILSYSKLATRQHLLDRLDEEERNAQRTSAAMSQPSL